MNLQDVKSAIEATKADYKRAKMWGSVYESGVIDGLDLALKTVDTCIERDKSEKEN